MKPTKRPVREKKRGKKNGKRGEERKRKVKVKTGVFKPKKYLGIFALCTCPNFASQYFSSGLEGHKVYDL